MSSNRQVSTLFVNGYYATEIARCERLLVVNERFDTHMQGLFVPFARVGSGDPVRVLRLFHNEYAGYN